MNNNSVESVTTTAGLLGFLTLFALALACWFLFRSMNARLRRMRFRAEQEEAAAAEESSGTAGPSTSGPRRR